MYDAVPSRTSSGNDPANCPDSLGKIKYFLVNGNTGEGTCKQYKYTDALQASADLVMTYTGSKNGIVDGSVTLYNNATDILPGADGTFLGPHILSKVASLPSLATPSLFSASPIRTFDPGDNSPSTQGWPKHRRHPV